MIKSIADNSTPVRMTPKNGQKCFDGTKTQTRRIIIPQPIEISWFEHQKGFCARVREGTGDAQHPAYVMVPCPFGKAGDRLWVQEDWAFPGEEALMYRGNPDDVKMYKKWMAGENYPKVTWTPDSDMPRWACRTVLEVTSVRVERLQDCSETDARAEGAAFVCELCGCDLDSDRGAAVHFACDDPDCERASHKEGFRRLWISINGAGSWDVNPWVWVIVFERVNERLSTNQSGS